MSQSIDDNKNIGDVSIAEQESLQGRTEKDPNDVFIAEQESPLRTKKDPNDVFIAEQESSQDEDRSQDGHCLGEDRSRLTEDGHWLGDDPSHLVGRDTDDREDDGSDALPLENGIDDDRQEDQSRLDEDGHWDGV